MSSEPLIAFNKVDYKPNNQTVLSNISFTLHQGEIVTVLGPNGAGKSTIAKLALGLKQPTSGQIVKQKGLRLGYMPQKLEFDRTMPISTHRFLSLMAIKPTLDDIKASLTEVRADYLINQSLHQLSGGELQRVMLARALLLKPDLLVLDEPAQGVDVIGQQDLYGLISRISQTHHCAILLISHDLHLVMAATNRVLCINQHICCSGSPDSVSKDPAYLNLFGREGSEQLAVYAHHHDHTHDLSGHHTTSKINSSHHTCNAADSHNSHNSPNSHDSPRL